MNAKEFLASKGVHSLDTKKRTNEVTQWLDEYAKQEAIGFAEWKDKVVAMKDKDGFWIVTTFSGLDYNQTYTIEQLYNLYKQKP